MSLKAESIVKKDTNPIQTDLQIMELIEYADFYEFSSLGEAIDYCSKCHFCGKKCQIDIHTHSHTYCKSHCQDMSEDFNYCCFRGKSCKICNNYSICVSKLLCEGYKIEQCEKFFSQEKELTLTYRIKSVDSETIETKMWSKTISTGKNVIILHSIKYKSYTFIAELTNDEKKQILQNKHINTNYYDICVKELGEQLDSHIEIYNTHLYSQIELDEINCPDESDPNQEQLILETRGWKQKLDAYYEILNGFSLELLLTKKFSEVVKSY